MIDSDKFPGDKNIYNAISLLFRDSPLNRIKFFFHFPSFCSFIHLEIISLNNFQFIVPSEMSVRFLYYINCFFRGAFVDGGVAFLGVFEELLVNWRHNLIWMYTFWHALVLKKIIHLFETGLLVALYFWKSEAFLRAERYYKTRAIVWNFRSKMLRAPP